MGRMAVNLHRVLPPLLSGRGMLGVLLLLCLYFSWATYHEEQPTGKEGAESLAESIRSLPSKNARIVVVSQTDATEAEFADTLRSRLKEEGFSDVTVVQGDPPTVRQSLETLAQS